jgi:hypothetical protein
MSAALLADSRERVSRNEDIHQLQTAQLDAWYEQFNPSDRAKNQNEGVNPVSA